MEGTAGNTGIGLAHICNSLGFQCHIYMPNNQSREKIEYLTALGYFFKLINSLNKSQSFIKNKQFKRCQG